MAAAARAMPDPGVSPSLFPPTFGDISDDFCTAIYLLERIYIHIYILIRIYMNAPLLMAHDTT